MFPPLKNYRGLMPRPSLPTSMNNRVPGCLGDFLGYIGISCGILEYPRVTNSCNIRDDAPERTLRITGKKKKAGNQSVGIQTSRTYSQGVTLNTAEHGTPERFRGYMARLSHQQPAGIHVVFAARQYIVPRGTK